MNILFVTSNLSRKSGVTSVLINYLRNINRNSNTFTIIYFDLVDAPSYKEELELLGINIIYIAREHFVSNLNKFCKTNYQYYDLIHINDPYLAPCFIGIKRRLGVKKVIFHAHSTKFSDTNLKCIRNYILSLPARIIGDYFFACSEIAGRKTFGKIFSKKGTIIYNAIDLEKFRFDQEARTRIRNFLNIDSKEVIGHVGNITPQKNHIFIINVFYEYLKMKPNALLLLVGDGYLREQVVKKIEDLKITDRVIFTGIISNVSDYLSAMDKFLFPSKFEGLGIALIEAQTNGLKCLFSDVVPMEADLCPTENTKLPLTQGANIWANELERLGVRDCHQVLSDNNYDIKQAAIKLENLYMVIVNEK